MLTDHIDSTCAHQKQGSDLKFAKHQNINYFTVLYIQIYFSLPMLEITFIYVDHSNNRSIHTEDGVTPN